MEKWGALCRQWAEIHPIPHKVHLLAFEVQSLTYSLGELGMFLLLLCCYLHYTRCSLLEMGQIQWEHP